MRLRDDHVKALEEQRVRQFIQELKGFLRDKHPDIVGALSEEELEHRIRYGIERAASHGLTWSYSISIFISMMFFVSPEFDQFPPAKAALSDAGTPPNERIDLMMRGVTAKQWAEARKRYAGASWPRMQEEAV